MVYSFAYACRVLSADSLISVLFNYTCGNDLSKLIISDERNENKVVNKFSRSVCLCFTLWGEDLWGRSKGAPPLPTYAYACVNL